MGDDCHKLILPLARPDDRPGHQVQVWYDTREGLQARLELGLEGLREIARARQEAGYDRRERLAEWCLLGCFWADTCGNLSAITEGAPAEAYRFMEYEGSLPKVLSRDEVGRYTHRWTSTMGTCLPPVEGRCDRCGGGWTLDNVRDFYWSSEKPPRHRECHRLAVLEREIKEISEIVRRAEIPFSDFYMIPNEYGRDPDYFGPWFVVETPAGRIKVGWRKRVINIDWAEASLQVPSATFAEENVTSWATGIHAWGADKAVEYLRRLWSAAVLAAPPG